MDSEPPQVTEPSPQAIKRRRRKFRWLTAISIAWFLGFPELLSFLSPDDNPPISHILIFAIAGWLWLLSGCWIYHALFTAAETRWPAAKGVREVVSPILRSLLFRHRQ